VQVCKRLGACICDEKGVRLDGCGPASLQQCIAKGRRCVQSLDAEWGMAAALGSSSWQMGREYNWPAFFLPQASFHNTNTNSLQLKIDCWESSTQPCCSPLAAAASTLPHAPKGWPAQRLGALYNRDDETRGLIKSPEGSTGHTARVNSEDVNIHSKGWLQRSAGLACSQACLPARRICVPSSLTSASPWLYHCWSHALAPAPPSPLSRF